MARDALESTRAYVALLNPVTGTWSAVTSEGNTLEDAEIARHGSKSLLEKMRKTWQPVVSVSSGLLDVDSESLRIQQAHSVLAVPLFFWDVTSASPERKLGGCLYAHRSAGRPPFEEADVALVRDIARIVEPNLNLLRYLRNLEDDLTASRQQIASLRRAAPASVEVLASYPTRDTAFATTVVARLASLVGRPGAAILLQGPEGSGKTHLARAFHASGARASGPFVVADPRRDERTAHAGDDLFRPTADGCLAAAAHRGTLCIEEVSLLTGDAQGRLLRLIETGVAAAEGGPEVPVDVQVFATTREDLQRLVFQMRFREDLFRRIHDQLVVVPPLADRAADVPDLARGFLRAAASRFGLAGLSDLTEAALGRLRSHDWSRDGNVRGLERAIHRAALLAPRGATHLDAAELPLDAPAR
jgi:transcriptional regulator with GAF, ATPase, and Fis domain